MSKERLEEAKLMAEMLRVETRLPHDFPYDLVDWLVEQSERVQELESFKNSVEYTVDSETLELIINNQDNDKVLSLSETYDEKIYLLQKRVQELEDKLARIRFVNNDYDKINKRYREALEFYADEETYEPSEVQVGAVTKEGYKILKYKYDPIINTDKGKKARQALENEEQ